MQAPSTSSQSPSREEPSDFKARRAQLSLDGSQFLPYEGLFKKDHMLKKQQEKW